MDRCKYLCCSGGGNKGYSYIGAVKAFVDTFPRYQGRTFESFLGSLLGVAGTSIGAFVALAFVVGQLDIECICKPFMSSFDIAPRADVRNFINQYGLDHGSLIKKMISDLLALVKLHESTTLKDLKRIFNKDFICCVTNINTGQPVYMSAANFPDTRVVDAIYMSMSVPFIFIPEKIEGCYIVDGGISDNVPKVFPAEETLFLKVADNVNKNEVANVFDYANFFINHLLRINEKNDKEYYSRGLTITMQLSPCVFNAMAAIGPHEINQRISLGYASTLEYWHPNLIRTCGQVVYILVSNTDLCCV